MPKVQIIIEADNGVDPVSVNFQPTVPPSILKGMLMSAMDVIREFHKQKAAEAEGNKILRVPPGTKIPNGPINGG